MKRFLLLAGLLLLSTVPARGKEAWRDWCWMGNQRVITSGLRSTTLVQASYPQCVVSIFVHGGGLATIFADNNGTPLANPFTAQTDGQFIWYAANGRYDQTITSSGLPQAITMSDILLCDPADAPLNGCGTASAPSTPLCSVTVAGSKDINPQVCSAAFTFQQLAAQVSNIGLQTLESGTLQSSADLSYFGSPTANFDCDYAKDQAFCDRDYLTVAPLFGFGMQDPMTRAPGVSKPDGMVVLVEQVNNANPPVAGAGTAIKGIFDLYAQTTSATGLWAGMGGKVFLDSTAAMGTGVGTSGEAYINFAPASALPGAIDLAVGMRALVINFTSTVPTTTMDIQLNSSKDGDVNALHEYALGYMGSSSALPTTWIDGYGSLGVDNGISLAAGHGTSSGIPFTVGSINAAGDVLCFSAGATVADCATSATNAIGVARTSANHIGDGRNSYVQFAGVVSMNYDNTFTPSAGWYACTSASVVGKVTPQVGACAAGRQAGIVEAGGIGVTSGLVWIQFK
jgi:hypothetical protein